MAHASAMKRVVHERMVKKKPVKKQGHSTFRGSSKKNTGIDAGRKKTGRVARRRRISERPKTRHRKARPSTLGRNKNQVNVFLSRRRGLSTDNLQSLVRTSNILQKEKMSGKQLESALKLLKKHGTDLPSLISSMKEAESLKSKYGRPYNEIVEDYGAKCEQVAEASARLKDAEAKEKELEGRISHLQELENLQSLLLQNHAQVDAVTNYIEQSRKLAETGYDINTVREIAAEVTRLGFDPKDAGRVIGSWLTRNKTIGEALVRSEQELDAKKKEEAITSSRILSLNRKVDEAQKKISELENYQASRRRSLENEYEARERALNIRIAEERSRAEAEMLDILRQRDRLRSENRVLKEEEETLRKEIELAKSLSAVIRDPQSLSSSQLESLVSEFAHANEIREKKKQQAQETEESNS